MPRGTVQLIDRLLDNRFIALLGLQEAVLQTLGLTLFQLTSYLSNMLQAPDLFISSDQCLCFLSAYPPLSCRGNTLTVERRRNLI